MKMTDGPWSIDFETNEDGPMICDEMNDIIAIICPSQDGDDTDKANAQAISAVPELIEALEALFRNNILLPGEPVSHDACSKIHDALAKARGEK